MDYQLESRYNKNKRPVNNKQYSSSSGGGSFYEMIPNVFEPIQKPGRDDILKQLRENTKLDKKTGWRMREKYGSNEFVGLGGGSQNRINCRYDDFGDTNSRGFPSSHWSDMGSVYTHPDVDKRKANFLREQCIKTGEMYGPQAIAAVSGYATQTKSWDFKGGDHYADDYDTKEVILWAKNCHMKNVESSSSGSAKSSARKSESVMKAWSTKADGSPETHNLHDNFCAAAAEVQDANTRSKTRSRVCRYKKVAPCTYAGKVSVEIGNPFIAVGGGDTSKGSRSQRIKKVQRSGRKTLRRKRVPQQNRKKSKARTEDTRHKGPKIQGFFSETAINEQSNVQFPERRIRTVVLRYPEPKYRHVM